jgi:uncharacterized protein DUF4397
VRVRIVLALAALAACDNGNGPPLPQASIFRALHAIRGGPALKVVVDERSLAASLGFGQLTRALALSPGLHTLDPQPPDTTPRVFLGFTTLSGVNYTAFVVDSTAGTRHIIDPVLVLDTGAVPAAGHSRLRIASFAAAAPAVDAYRTQPDSTGLLVSAQPLNVRAVTRYFDGAPGAWSVVISHAGMTDTLLATGSIPIADGQAGTVVVLDSTAGRVTWRLVSDRN